MESENRAGIELSKKGLMDTFGWNWAKVERLLRAGCPVVRDGGFSKDGSPRPWVFNSVDVWSFHEEHEAQKRRARAEANRTGSFLKPLHPNDPRYRVAAAQADRLERANMRDAANVLAKDDAVAIVDEIFGMLRAHFGKLPGAIVSQLGATGESAVKVERWLKREVDAALSGLDAREIAEIQMESEPDSELF